MRYIHWHLSQSGRHSSRPAVNEKQRLLIKRDIQQAEVAIGDSAAGIELIMQAVEMTARWRIMAGDERASLKSSAMAQKHAPRWRWLASAAKKRR